jgi:hypothetical protein
MRKLPTQTGFAGISERMASAYGAVPGYFATEMPKLVMLSTVCLHAF